MKKNKNNYGGYAILPREYPDGPKVTLQDLLAEYDLGVLKRWLDEQHEQEQAQESHPPRNLTLLEKK